MSGPFNSMDLFLPLIPKRRLFERCFQHIKTSFILMVFREPEKQKQRLRQRIARTTKARVYIGQFSGINLIGILYQKGKINTFENIHEKFPNFLSALCKEYSVKQFIHLSALGIEKAEDSLYGKSKLKGEVLIRLPWKASAAGCVLRTLRHHAPPRVAHSAPPVPRSSAGKSRNRWS